MLSFSFPGEAVPYVRMNHQNRWTDRVQNYLAYKRAFAGALAAAFPHLVDHGPPTEQKKERAAWLKLHKNTQYHLTFKVYEAKEKGDWDNYGKTIGDALQDSGVIPNDKKIKAGSFEILIDPANPRVELTLTKENPE